MSSQPQDPYNKGGYLAFMFTMIFCFAFFFYISFIQPGVDLKEVEEQAAAQADQVLVDAGAAKKGIDIASVEKPWLEDSGVAQHGAGVYKNNCAVCHGNEGKGDGPAGGALVPPPRNLIEGKWKKGGSSVELFVTLQKGIEGGSMASFAHLSVADRWALVQFIRSITKDKVADDPAKLEAFAKTAK
jgi:mono/diheme cytochrome c family protein